MVILFSHILMASDDILKKEDVIAYIGIDEDCGVVPFGEEIIKRAVLEKKIKSAGPQLFKILSELISKNQSNLLLVYRSFEMLNERAEAGDEACRKLALDNLHLLKRNSRYLDVEIIKLLGKCGKAEDADLIVDLMKDSDNTWLRVEVARTLSKIGNKKTLARMKELYKQIEIHEPERLERERKKIEDLGKSYKVTVKRLSQGGKTYLDKIKDEIYKMDKRLGEGN